MIQLRSALNTDQDAICAIWNPIIRNTSITFTPDEKTSADITALIAKTYAAGDVFLVADDGGHVLGFALTSSFRAGAGYRHVRELTIHLAPEARGQGTGRALIEELIRLSKANATRALIAGISAENTAAQAFHARFGFEEFGRLPQVCTKFGRALDLVLMQKLL